jgi:acetyl-CoA C-acetyltransferase
MGRPVIVSACRTAIGKFQGALAPLTAPQLGGVVVKEALARAGVPQDQVEEVLMGNVLQAGLGQNPARQSSRLAGIPDAAAAVTINKVCGSGLKTVMLAAQAIKAGDLKVAVAGGMESMTNTPYYLPSARQGTRLGHAKALDGIVWDGLWDHYNDFHMGNTAELVAQKYDVSRADQDAYAAESHRRAVAAQEAGHFDAEICSVEIPQRKGDPVQFAVDEGPRKDTSAESLGKLRPAFQRDGGTVTAGNASSINDGASALVVCEEEWAKAHGLCHRRPGSRVGHDGARGSHPEALLPDGLSCTGLRPRRDERGVQRADGRVAAAVGDRPSALERPRRCSRSRSPDRLFGRPRADHAAACPAQPRQATRPRRPVSRWRQRRRHGS